MRKKMITGLIALAFVCSSFLVMVSCAKKQVGVSEGVQPTPEAKATVTKPATKADDDYAKREKARQAKLKALRDAQMVANFEAQSIYFDFDKSDLKPAAKATLKNKAAWLRDHVAYVVRIDGHCDERGTAEYNLALGERRAHAAKKFLMALGVSEHRMSGISYGEEKPADPGHNEGAWAKNRRDEFNLVKRW
ncbi:MAG: peptidoglycan-associated lipoprotein Pal [Deltaproteobacteria bacterium]|nr:peptidoglycan-associated lipoprotein Pal [Deltaproteobacteria bacterium]